MNEPCVQVTIRGTRCRNSARAGYDRCSLHLAGTVGRTRPSRLEPEVAERLIAWLRAGNFVSVSCDAAGISRATFKLWMKRGASGATADLPYREFRERVERARAEAETRGVTQVAQAAGDDWRAASWMLERQHPARWGRGPRPAGLGDELATETGLELAPPPLSTRPLRRAIREAYRTLEAIGEDAELSRGAIDRYVTAVQAWRSLEREWAELGRPGTTLGGATGMALVPHPLVAQVAGARREASYLGSILGLDPQGRLRLSRRVGAGRPAGAASAPDRAAPPLRRTLRSVG